MEILPLLGVEQNMSPRSDTPPKSDASPLYPKARQATNRCYSHVTTGHEMSIACDPYGKKGAPT
jgi:hypothetical protein